MNSGRSHAVKSLLVVFFTVCAILCVGVIPTQAQSEPNIEILVQESKFKDQPIEISEVRVKTKKIELGKVAIDSDNQWLKELSFDVRNTSSKAITYIQMRLLFERPNGSGTPSIFPLIRGIDSVIREGKSSTDPDDAKRTILVRPGDLVRFKFDDKTYGGLQRFFSDLNREGDVTNVTLYPSRVIFEDGTIWMKGWMAKPDPANPKRLVPASQLDSTSKVELNDDYLCYSSQIVSE